MIATPLSCLSAVGTLFVLVLYALPVLIISALLVAIPIGAAHALNDRGRARAADRRARGLCPICAYDLRASPDRCPECGARPHPIDSPRTSDDWPAIELD